MSIDAHAHWYSEACLKAVAQYAPDIALERAPDTSWVIRWRGSFASHVSPAAADFADRVGLMDSLGIEQAILSFGAIDIGWSGDHAADVASLVNNLLAEVCRTRPDRFRFSAVLPLNAPGKMIDELDRALAMGAVGIATTTTFAGRPLHAPEYREFWRLANERRLPVSIHPCFPANGPENDAGGFLLCGFPGETTLAATGLVLAGVLAEYPDVPIVWSHLGGALAMLVKRLDAGARRFPACPELPSAYLRRCYYDTVCSHGPALECARDSFGAGALLLGTDEPHRVDQPADIVAAIRSRSWPDAEKAAVLGENAKRLFGLAS